MNQITGVTRQDIIDIVRNGVWIQLETPQYDNDRKEFLRGFYEKMPFFGRLSEIDFLSRIYDLDHMPSYDSRFKNASGDIWQHTVNNDDWEPYWFFSDDRFQLSNGNDDQFILKFICEMLHPAVRLEQYKWEKYLERFNEILKPDGYELISVRIISGRDVYAARRIDSVMIQREPETIYAEMKSIGEGSYAQVFRFKDSFYHKHFVLKRAKSGLTEKEIARFKREFEEMQKLHSPYIVEVYSYSEERNEYIMESMDYTLEKYIDSHNSTLPNSSRKSIILQLLHAFNYLHSKNIYHRDISFNNVLLKEYDDAIVVKISDFGLIKKEDSELTSEHTAFKGSLNDPALKIEGFSNYGLLHEVYSLTLLFVYILTGKKNWDRITDPIIRELLEKGTNADKTKRFQSLDELGEGVKRCFSNMGA